MAEIFDFRLAEQLARASDFAYHRDIRKQPELQDIQHDEPIDRDTSHLSVLEFSDRIIVAFRGTEPNIPDWLQNLKTVLVDCKVPGTDVAIAGRVHEGFYGELAKVWEPLSKEIARINRESEIVNKPQKNLYITGHSQGAGIAAIATAVMVKAEISVTATYTFAAPRPGDATFADGLEQQTIHRVEIGDDIVPHVPPKIPDEIKNALPILLAGAPRELKRLFAIANPDYVAVGKLAYGPVGELVLPELTSSQEAHQFVVRLMRLFNARKHLVEDHNVANYVESVNKF